MIKEETASIAQTDNNEIIRDAFDLVSEVRTLILGAQGSGKTSILKTICFRDVDGTIEQKHGYNIKTLQREGEKGIFHFWDLSPSLERKYFFSGVRAVIYVIDSSDPSQFVKIRDDIAKLHNDEELSQASFLFLANKSDKPSSLSVKKVTNRLWLNKLSKRAWKIFPCIAEPGNDLNECLDWLWEDVNTHPADKVYIEEEPEPEEGETQDDNFRNIN